MLVCEKRYDLAIAPTTFDTYVRCSFHSILEVVAVGSLQALSNLTGISVFTDLLNVHRSLKELP